MSHRTWPRLNLNYETHTCCEMGPSYALLLYRDSAVNGTREDGNCSLFCVILDKSLRIKADCWVQWLTSVIPALWEALVGRWLDLKSSRPAWAT